MIALKFLAAGLIVIALLCVLLAMEEGLKWHMEEREDD